MELEQQIKQAAEKAVLRFISEGQWLLPNYESRIKVPAEWLADCWRMVDSDKLKAQIAARLESELADRIVNHMAAELATDIKQLLSVQERREAIRALARKHTAVLAHHQQVKKVPCPTCGKKVKACGLADHQRDAHSSPSRVVADSREGGETNGGEGMEK